MTEEQSNLANSRLRLGITNVGFWVLAACAGLAWVLVAGSNFPGFWAVAMIGGFAILVQAGFDFVGGAVLVSMPRPTRGEFFRRWIRGVMGHSFVLLCVALMSGASFVFTGGFCLAVLISSIALAAARIRLLRMIGGIGIEKGVHDGRGVLIAKTNDPAFTGGAVGLGRWKVSLIPARWVRELPSGVSKAESIRRQWQMNHGMPARAFIVVLIWNLFGAAAGALIFDFGGGALAAAVFGHACWMTLWAFFSLLLLPSLSRGVVFAADHAAWAAGCDLREWIALFPCLVTEDGSADAATQSIFYPVPSSAMRLQRLGKTPPRLVLGSLSRCYLYYSWSTLTLLGRSVHCNIGRPALWVFPPAA